MLMAIVVVIAAIALFAIVSNSSREELSTSTNNPSTISDESDYGSIRQITQVQEENAVDIPPDPLLNEISIPVPEDISVTMPCIFVGETITIHEEPRVQHIGSLNDNHDKDVYVFTAPRDGRYGFSVTGLNSGDSIRLMVYDDSGYTVMDMHSKTCAANLTGNQNYEIQIRKDNGAHSTS